jgi:hypothetical protein
MLVEVYAKIAREAVASVKAEKESDADAVKDEVVIVVVVVKM